MGKALSEMTLAELWQLFPIFLVEHQREWEEQYATEAARLAAGLLPNVRIHWIGSTAIAEIWAKPIVDILVESDVADFSELKKRLQCLGYICMNENERQLDFNKGYTPEGFAKQVFHLHLREYGDNDELYFRDYLNENIEIAKQYEQLKLTLWKKYEHDRNAYTEAKTEFVCCYTQAAKKQYGKRY